MKNQKLEWKDLWDAMEEKPSDWIPTTQTMFWQMLEVLPPRAMAQMGDAFLVGEPLRDDAEGKPIYACFNRRKKAGGFHEYFAKNLTVNQFKAIF
jgi:hypothetical protein